MRVRSTMVRVTAVSSFAGATLLGSALLFCGTAGAAALRGAGAGGTPTLYYEGKGNTLLQAWIQGGAWVQGSPPIDSNAEVYSAVSVIPNSSTGGLPSAYFQGPNRSLEQHWLDVDGHWKHFTVDPNPDVVSAPGAFNQNGSPQVYFWGPKHVLDEAWIQSGAVGRRHDRCQP
jgi:hypothetical protein